MADHLSPEELQSLRKLPNQLPTRGGRKDFAPDGSDTQAATLRTVIQEYENVLREERVVRKGALSVGFWDDSKKTAEISCYQGTHWNTFGKVINGVMTVQPEEALFLIDVGALELYFNELPLSLQEAYQLLITDDFPLEHYIVYAHLARLGFILRRHRSLDTDLAKPTKSSQDQPISTLPVNKPCTQSPLWEGDVTPLVHPGDANSTASVLSKLQVIKTLRMKDAFVERRTNLQITFDAYQPGSPFKKRNPGPPDFHIVVCRQSDPVPSPADIIQVTRQTENVPLKMALVGNGGVSFYSFSDVDLPTFL